VPAAVEDKSLLDASGVEVIIILAELVRTLLTGKKEQGRSIPIRPSTPQIIPEH